MLPMSVLSLLMLSGVQRCEATEHCGNLRWGLVEVIRSQGIVFCNRINVLKKRRERQRHTHIHIERQRDRARQRLR